MLPPILLCILIWSVETLSAKELGFSTNDDELIDYINNNPDIKWRAEKSDRFKTMDDFRMLLGVIKSSVRDPARKIVSHADKNIELPASFDSREKWKYCPTIANISDQSKCGSCWAFGAATAMSDRVCIHSAGKRIVELSPTDLISCCKLCGAGCYGGWPSSAWDYWVDQGVVTGSGYQEKTGCRPYPFPPSHLNKAYPNGMYRTPKCEKKCENGADYEKDKVYGQVSYTVDQKEESIMKEIWLNGPVEAAFNVYEDFRFYKEGIYHHVGGKILSGHAVRMIGWGEDKGEKYWLVANSWNVKWGEKGLFRIRRGVNECGIEGDIDAGLPKL
ncbi:unnamed protein product [Calicophoron daubneyi]|uniref:Cathepsin B-like cysteine proteinase n=1 Tax=Calicophoron daubneyi TaxID=300641 RepID=A0AAV2TMT7_CALDB